MKNCPTKLWVITTILVFCIGVSLGKLLNWGYFIIDKNLSIIDALNFFATIGVAIYVAAIIEKNHRIQEKESDLHNSKILELESLISDILNVIDEEKIKYALIISRVHRIGIIKNFLYKEIDKNTRYKNDCEITEITSTITEDHIRLKRLLTETPIYASGNQEIKLSKGTVVYSEGRKEEILTSACTICQKYFQLRMLINRL